MPRAKKPYLVVIWLDSECFVAAIVDRTKKSAAERAFAHIEDPGGTTAKSLARYTAEVFRDPKSRELWVNPAAWTGPRLVSEKLFTKKYLAFVMDKEMPPLDRHGAELPTRRRDLRVLEVDVE